MSGDRVQRTSYAVDVAAPAGVVYGLIADTTQWPLFVPPSVHVERLEFDGTSDRFRMWVTADGGVKSWISRRSLDPGRRTIDFRQEVPAAPATSMGGRWAVEELGRERSRLTLVHDFTAADDCPAATEWLTRATDSNSRAELAQLKETAELWTKLDDLRLTVEDSVRIHGPAELVYDVLYGVEDWPGHLPHVDRLDVREDQPGIQVMSMESRTADGAVRTTGSVRVCFPHAGRIVFKQTATLPLVAAHTGEWSVVPDETGVTAVATHNVLLREEAVGALLGPGADIAQARRHVHEALSRTSTATLDLAKRHAESAVRILRPGS
ncbi:aromatase/cyclase [Streptomyces sp. NPDC057445]|uniref:aromatase/cyclase n=1 Tax=Streptomyces sp. NPDC057445 TaxID=3346136 RepID=UPI0036948EAD